MFPSFFLDFCLMFDDLIQWVRHLERSTFNLVLLVLRRFWRDSHVPQVMGIDDLVMGIDDLY